MKTDYFTTFEEADDEDLDYFDPGLDEVSDTDLSDVLLKLATYIQKEGTNNRAALLEKAKQILNSKGILMVYD